MKLYCNNLWWGFIEKTNPVHCDFFIDLCSRIWNTRCELGNKEDSDILLESIFSPSCLKDKAWKYSILFSGESRIYSNTSEYTLVLYGQRNHDNIINCPLFIPYIYTNNYISRLETPSTICSIPQNKVLVVISNSGGEVRNMVLKALEQEGIEIVYAGEYKNNIGGKLDWLYNTDEFLNYVSQFKFIMTMENSRDDTYITEKICHGMLAGTIPIYWGSKRVSDYFNQDRFINIDSTDDIQKTIEIIKAHFNDDSLWQTMVSQPILSDGLWRNIDTIAADCRAILNASGAFKKISTVQFICNKDFEPVRYERLEKMVSDLQIDTDKVKFCCPTYKHTITSDIFSKYVRTPMNHLLPWVNRNLRKSELSIFLNYRKNLEIIDRNYLDGLFFIFESDIVQHGSILNISNAFDILSNNRTMWDMVHLGYGGQEQMWNPGYIEDFTNSESMVRFERRVNTRCLDSNIFTKRGIEKLLLYLKTNDDYAEPLDHYISRYLENDSSYKYYWSDPTYFIQMSTYGGEYSNIQNDTS